MDDFDKIAKGSFFATVLIAIMGVASTAAGIWFLVWLTKTIISAVQGG